MNVNNNSEYALKSTATLSKTASSMCPAMKRHGGGVAVEPENPLHTSAMSCYSWPHTTTVITAECVFIVYVYI